MRYYFYLSSSFPPLALGVRPEWTFRELKDRLRENLSSKDRKAFQAVLKWGDLFNLRSLLMNHPVNEYGQFRRNEIEQHLMAKDGFDDGVFDWLERYTTLKEQVEHFPRLIHQFFSCYIPISEGFLKRYFTWEREMRLVLLMLRSRQREKGFQLEMEGEEIDDLLMYEIRRSMDSGSFQVPVDYVDLEKIYEANRSEPWSLYKKILEYRFRKVDELAEGEAFSRDRVFSYAIQLQMLEQAAELEQRMSHHALQEIKKLS